MFHYPSLKALQEEMKTFVDVTAAVSAAITDKIPDYGFRIAYSGSQETDAVTRFVKRFSSRQSRNTNIHPALVVKYNDSFLTTKRKRFLIITIK